VAASTPAGVAILAATTPWPSLREALDSLSEGFGTRCVTIEVAGSADIAPIAPQELLWLERYPIPKVAALSGEVGGPALDLALACDIRVCDAETILQFTAFGTRRLMTLLGLQRSVAVLEAQGRVTATTALEAGVVSDVAPAGGAAARALEVAGQVAARGPIATRLATEAIWRGLELPLEPALRFETDLTLLLQTTKDRAEGVRAFLEKRPPTFTGN
jgi:enoyl-CoA hydratase/carnithine racemase